MDRNILLWNAIGECSNYGILTGHKSAVLDLHWSRDSQVIYSASADMHIASWNVETGERIRRHVGHEEVRHYLRIALQNPYKHTSISTSTEDHALKKPNTEALEILWPHPLEQ